MYALKLKCPVLDKMSQKAAASETAFSIAPSVAGMKVLDRDAFTLNVLVTGVKVPMQSVGVVRRQYKQWLLKMPKLPPIAELSDSDADRQTHKLFLFSPNHVKSENDFDEVSRTFLSKKGVDLADIQQYTIKLTYENFKYDSILDAILPGENAVGGFSVIGHIAHLNLRDHLLEYKNIIGSSLTSVVILLPRRLFFHLISLLAGFHENCLPVTDFHKIQWTGKVEEPVRLWW